MISTSHFVLVDMRGVRCGTSIAGVPCLYKSTSEPTLHPHIVTLVIFVFSNYWINPLLPGAPGELGVPLICNADPGIRTHYRHLKIYAGQRRHWGKIC
jgi:hypothetical protein